MNNMILSAALIVSSPFSLADENVKVVEVRGEAARGFIERHFPDMILPGSYKGAFTYRDRKGVEKDGYATCTVPVMDRALADVDTVCSLSDFTL